MLDMRYAGLFQISWSWWHIRYELHILMTVIMCLYVCAELMPVSSVSVDYTCTTHSGMVSWSAVFGAESYKAFAMGDNGTQLTCTSQSTSCQISGLTCGQSYVVHVIPMSASCTNMINTTSATFQTGETENVLNMSVNQYYNIVVQTSSSPLDKWLSIVWLFWVEWNILS